MQNLTIPESCPTPGGSFSSRVFTLTLALVCCFALSLSAQNNPRISVQGTLKTANGVTVADDSYDVIFNLYDVETGGTALWSENAMVEVVGGIYSHYLGSTTLLKPADFSKTLYLGVKIGNYELVPRTELSYAPYAFSVTAAQTVVCSGAVGDIKYSILNPTEFAKVNGDCWVPMDGRSIAGTQLATHGVATIPDAGGMFLRAQEFAGKADNDPDRTSAFAIATVQQDAFGNHTHTMGNAGEHKHEYNDIHMDENQSGGDYPTGDGVGRADEKRETFSTGSHNHIINPTGGTETRPKNLNFWIYIRIN